MLARKIELMLADERLHVQVSGQEFAYGGELGRIREIGVADAEGQARTWFTTGEPVVVRMLVEAHEDLPEPIFALTIKNTAGVEIYGTNTLYSGQLARPIKAGELREVIFAFDLDLLLGITSFPLASPTSLGWSWSSSTDVMTRSQSKFTASTGASGSRTSRRSSARGHCRRKPRATP